MTDEEIRALVDEFNRKVSLDPEIRSVMQKIRNQDADFSDTSRMFWRRSELLRNYLQGIVLNLPAGDREKLCTALLNAGYNETNEVMQSVQQALDEPQGIHLNPVLPKRPVERIVQVAHALEDPTVPDDKIVRRAGAPVANVNMSFHDKYIEENARIRAKLGMKPTITRYGSGCCKWCSEVAGRYRFGDQPKDIFRRHDNCGCTIIYDNQVLRGRETSSGRSKTWEEVDPKSVEALGFTPTVHTHEQAKKLQENELDGLTLYGNRSIIRAITVDDIVSAGIIDKQQPSVIKEDVAKAIIDTISAAKKAGGKFSFDAAKVVSIPQKENDQGMVVFQTNAIDRFGYPYVVLEINVLAIGDLDVESVDAIFSQAQNTECNSLVEAIIHEIGHAKTIYGRTYANYERIVEDLNDVHIDGVSTLAKKDGLELIAESEVILSRGGKLNPEIMEIYNTYTTGGG